MRIGPMRARFLAAVVVLIVAPAAAEAYIDPGSGAYMVQALFTVVAAGIFYVRHPIRTLRAIGAWFAGRRRRSATPDPTFTGADASVANDVAAAQQSKDG